MHVYIQRYFAFFYTNVHAFMTVFITWKNTCRAVSAYNNKCMQQVYYVVTSLMQSVTFVTSLPPFEQHFNHRDQACRINTVFKRYIHNANIRSDRGYSPNQFV